MKKAALPILTLIVVLLVTSCPDFLGNEPAGRWNPADDNYDASTDPDAVTDPSGKPVVSIESSADTGTTVSSVTWQWSADIDLCVFRYYVGMDDSFEFTDEEYGVTQYYYLENVNGTYYLFVQARAPSGIESEVASATANLIGGDTTPPDVTIRLIHPAAGAYTGSVGTSNINFVWTVDDESDVDEWHVRVGNAEDLETATVSQTFDFSTSSGQVQVGTIDGPYYGFWQAGAEDAAGNITWSDVRRIRFGYAPNDIDADGYSDVLAGASYWNTNYGRVRLFTGTATTPSLHTPIFEGANGGENVGMAVNFIGDFDGDGTSDFALVNNWASGGIRVFLSTKSGFPDLAGSIPLTVAGESYGAAFAGGDFNGDGYDDLAVGARGYSTYQGRVYLYLGNAGGTLGGYDAVSFTGDTNYACLGAALDFADVNGDGFDDLIASAPGYPSPAGRVYVFFGSSGTPDLSSADTTLTGSGSEYFGFDVAGGDINGDGYADIVVGIPAYATNRGAVSVYQGGETVSETPFSWSSDYADDDHTWGGISVACGDVTGDRFAEVLVGSPGYDTNRYGAVWVYLGEDSPAVSWSACFKKIWANSPGNGYRGQSVGVGGDVNRDGFNDILFSAAGMDGSYTDSGRIGITFGGSNPNANYDVYVGDYAENELLGGWEGIASPGWGRKLGRM